MKLLGKLSCAGIFALFFLLVASPANAQFEVNPDHPDDQEKQTVNKPFPVVRKNDAKAKSTGRSAALKANVSVARKNLKSRSKKGAGHAATASAHAAKHEEAALARQPEKNSQTPRLKAQATPVQRE